MTMGVPPKTWAVTGHRPDKLGGYDEHTTKYLIEFATDELKRNNVAAVITGMALGWDQAIAQAAADLGIPFTAAVPFKGQERKWSPASQLRYRALLDMAIKVKVVCAHYTPAAFKRRNIWMVKNADALLALMEPGTTKGGTFHCHGVAARRGLEINNVWDRWMLYKEARRV